MRWEKIKTYSSIGHELDQELALLATDIETGELQTDSIAHGLQDSRDLHLEFPTIVYHVKVRVTDPSLGALLINLTRLFYALRSSHIIVENVELLSAICGCNLNSRP